MLFWNIIPPYLASLRIDVLAVNQSLVGTTKMSKKGHFHQHNLVLKKILEILKENFFFKYFNHFMTFFIAVKGETPFLLTVMLR